MIEKKCNRSAEEGSASKPLVSLADQVKGIERQKDDLKKAIVLALEENFLLRQKLNRLGQGPT